MRVIGSQCISTRSELSAFAEELMPRVLGIVDVIVAASSPHRGEAFAGAREVIDRVKAEAPIWKKEVEGGDERWVEGTPPPAA